MFIIKNNTKSTCFIIFCVNNVVAHYKFLKISETHKLDLEQVSNKTNITMAVNYKGNLVFKEKIKKNSNATIMPNTSDDIPTVLFNNPPELEPDSDYSDSDSENSFDTAKEEETVKKDAMPVKKLDWFLPCDGDINMKGLFLVKKPIKAVCLDKKPNTFIYIDEIKEGSKICVEMTVEYIDENNMEIESFLHISSNDDDDDDDDIFISIISINDFQYLEKIPNNLYESNSNLIDSDSDSSIKKQLQLQLQLPKELEIRFKKFQDLPDDFDYGEYKPNPNSLEMARQVILLLLQFLKSNYQDYNYKLPNVGLVGDGTVEIGYPPNDDKFNVICCTINMDNPDIFFYNAKSNEIIPIIESDFKKQAIFIFEAIKARLIKEKS